MRYRNYPFEEFGRPEYPYLKSVLGEDYQDAPVEDLHEAVRAQFGEVDLNQMEDFLQTLSDVGQAALPIAGTIAGSVIGGPVGGALGAAAGNLAAGAIKSATAPDNQPAPRPKPKAAKPALKKRPPKKAPPRVAPPAVIPGPASTNPAAQLLTTMVRPEVLQSVAAAAMGPAGAPAVKVGDNELPVGAILAALAGLATQAQASITPAQDGMLSAPPGTDGGDGGYQPVAPEYMYDESGEPLGDWTCADDRARVVLDILNEGWTTDSEDDARQGDRDEYELLMAQLQLAMQYDSF